MKNTIIYLAVILMFCVQNVNAQRFIIPLDTTRAVISATGYMYNSIKNTSNEVIDITWQVVSHDFPLDWQKTFAVCDNITCYYNNNESLMKADGTGALPKMSDTFGSGRTALFYLLMNLSDAQPGSHYVQMNMSDGLTDKDSWYFISKWPTGIVTVNQTLDEAVTVYPNPAQQEINILHNKVENANRVELMNVYGQKVGQYETGKGVTKIFTGNLSRGVYLINVLSNNGQLLGTAQAVLK